MKSKKLNKFKALSKGAGIGILSLGGPLSPARYAQGLDALRRLGFSPRTPLDPSRDYGNYAHGFANGSPQERAAAFRKLLEDPQVEMILSARGAYGAMEVLPLLDEQLLQQHPKPIIGMSDLTSLLVQMPERYQFSSFHGPSLGSAFADMDTSPEAARSVELLLRTLQDPDFRYSALGTPLRDGVGEGPIIAGNLTVLQSLLGTNYDINYDKSVLVLEDVGEAPYRVHRALLQLHLAGKFANLSALVFGRFSRCTAPFGPSVEEVLTTFSQTFLAATKFPILCGLTVGHWGENHTLGLGLKARVTEEEFKIVESPLSQ